MVDFTNINIGSSYNRNSLTELWNYRGIEAISRGVVTPANSSIIVLFVTKEKQSSATQYIDYISDDFLYWEGEKEGRSNNRILNSERNNDQIHLFFRQKHREDFLYLGIIVLQDFIPNEKNPMKFVFKIIGKAEDDYHEFKDLYFPIYGRKTEKRSLQLSRIGQGAFRFNLFDIWDACSITNIRVPELLKASHIKSWKESNDKERLDPYNGLLFTPTLDALFDKGFISFSNNGIILLSRAINEIKEKLNISEDMRLRKVYDNNIKYLEHHREYNFIK